MKIQLFDNKYNKIFSFDFLKKSSCLTWIVWKILILPAVVVGSYLALKKVITVWSKHENQTTKKTNQLGLKRLLCRVFGRKNPKCILSEWITVGSSIEYWEEKYRSGAKGYFLSFLNDKEMHHLNLRDQKFTSLPDIFHCEPFQSQLQILELVNCSFETLPESITSLASLKEINFAHCRVNKKLSKSLTNFILDIWVRQAPREEHQNRIRAKEKIVNLVNFLNSSNERYDQVREIRLDLSNLGLTSLPDIYFICNYDSKLTINLTGNHLKDVPLSIIERILDTWVEEPAITNAWNKRKRAKNNIIDFFLNNRTRLCLYDIDISTLPNIFHFEPFQSKLQALTCTECSLKTLPESITSLASLKKIDFINCRADEELSESSMSFILDIWVKQAPEEEHQNRLIAKDRILNFLKDNNEACLDLAHLGLTSFPDIGFILKIDRLEAINLIGNHLKDAHLFVIKVILDGWIGQAPREERLARIMAKDKIVDFLTSNNERGYHLILSDLHFSTLPKIFHHCLFQNLRHLDLSHNTLLSGIPMELLDLPNSLTIDFTGCNFSDAVLSRLQEITHSPDYRGPHISYSIREARNNDETRPIQDSFEELCRITSKIPTKFSEEFPHLEQKEELKSWLSRLSNTADYRKGGEQQQLFADTIMGYLRQANENQEFRKAFYHIIQEASQTCGDRVALSVLHIGIAYQLSIIDLKDMRKLADFFKGIWAMSMLEDIARNKISTLPFFDEIEVYLGYPIKLKEKLHLPIDVQEMLFFSCSALSDQDIEDAKDFVLKKQENQEAFFEFLITQGEWKEALSLNYKKEYEAILAKRTNATELEDPDYAAIEQTYTQALKELTEKAFKASRTVSHFDLLNRPLSGA